MSRFTKIGANGEQLAADAEGCVAALDTKQGLMFTTIESEEMTHAQAVEYVAGLEVAGFKDWRLPTVEELFLLADRSRVKSPAIDTDIFPDCKSDWYWTGTLYAPSPGDYAWDVGFGNGSAGWVSQDGGGFVRACRAGQ